MIYVNEKFQYVGGRLRGVSYDTTLTLFILDYPTKSSTQSGRCTSGLHQVILMSNLMETLRDDMVVGGLNSGYLKYSGHDTDHINESMWIRTSLLLWPPETSALNGGFLFLNTTILK